MNVNMKHPFLLMLLLVSCGVARVANKPNEAKQLSSKSIVILYDDDPVDAAITCIEYLSRVE